MRLTKSQVRDMSTCDVCKEVTSVRPACHNAWPGHSPSLILNLEQKAIWLGTYVHLQYMSLVTGL